jgi:hypothetical protein
VRPAPSATLLLALVLGAAACREAAAPPPAFTRRPEARARPPSAEARQRFAIAFTAIVTPFPPHAAASAIVPVRVTRSPAARSPTSPVR